MEVVASLERFVRGHVFHVQHSLLCPNSQDESKGLIVTSSSGSAKATKMPTFSPLLTFPRHVSQQRATGVNTVGAALRRGNQY